MASAPPAPRRLRGESGGIPTSPLRIYAGDHQPIRLLAELEGVSAAELVHRAMEAYVGQHGRRLAEVSSRAQRMVEAGDLDGLARVLDNARAARRSSRAARLSQLAVADPLPDD